MRKISFKFSADHMKAFATAINMEIEERKTKQGLIYYLLIEIFEKLQLKLFYIKDNYNVKFSLAQAKAITHCQFNHIGIYESEVMRTLIFVIDRELT